MAESVPAAAVEPREIDDDEWLSQCGLRRRDRPWNFPNAPRPGKEPAEYDVSFVAGQLSVTEAARAAFGPSRRPDRRDAVRHVRARELRSAGFSVEHTPRLTNPDHVSVTWVGEGAWDASVSALLDAACCEGEVGP